MVLKTLTFTWAMKDSKRIRTQVSGLTCTPSVCKIIAFMAVVIGLGLLFYILLGFR